MKISSLFIPEVKILEPQYFEDSRGYFAEVYSKKVFNELGINVSFVQDNHSYTAKKGTIRGFHCQLNPDSQDKLVRCIRGAILDVAVDVRKNSETYLKSVSVILSEENKKQIYIPSGFLHGFITLTDNCEIIYKVNKFYNPKLDRSVAWNDPDINFAWNIENPILSEKDKNAPLLRYSDIKF